ncbi:Lrp/AsnC family transcriptional regulator [Flexibacterium corallicola]|uniref:Lrp/AsnC family transcriptional regulator n=1 Tax=Flexibacterium corallicola TaxID=3037259 RepID=UPI00286F6544|nr:Lrp/AsnC family transcriptional regulator [Pseudovibrio sp. M1P-2-3]
MPRIKDELDRKLISVLQANAREPISSISRKLNVPRSTIQERITRLERSGVISGYTAILGEDLNRQPVQAIVLLSVDQQQSKELVKQMESYPEIKTCMTISGEFDMFLVIEPGRLEELDDLLDSITAVPGVVRSRSSIVLSQKFHRPRPAFPGDSGENLSL